MWSELFQFLIEKKNGIFTIDDNVVLTMQSRFMCNAKLVISQLHFTIISHFQL